MSGQSDRKPYGSDSPAALARIRRDATLIHPRQQVEEALDRMASAITTEFAPDAAAGSEEGAPLVLIAVMTGGMIPAVWLSTRLDFPHQLDYVHASRYAGGTRGGELNWLARPRLPLAGRRVLIVDDILDEGVTLKSIASYCRQAQAAQVSTAVLVQKIHGRCGEGIAADFVGLEVPDLYVFGCGMDYNEHFRDLTSIYALAPGSGVQR
ncbi:MAG: hypoxanthine-guanine phosphoribosyltransferase [Gammaproteobacteria bacterium]